MALSGSVQTNAYDGRYLKLEWTAKQNAGDNVSTIYWTLSAVGGNVSWYNTGPVSVQIATSRGISTYVYNSTNRVRMYTGTITQGQTTFAHKDDGTLKITITIRAAIYASAENCTGTATFTLDTIPQAPVAPYETRAVALNDKEPSYYSLDYVSIGYTARFVWLVDGGSDYNITGFQWGYRWYRQGAWGEWTASKSVSKSTRAINQPVTSTSANAGDKLQFRVRSMNNSYASAWVLSNSLTVAGGMRVNANGAWKQGLAFVNINGAWKTAQRVYVKVNGVWKEST